MFICKNFKYQHLLKLQQTPNFLIYNASASSSASSSSSSSSTASSKTAAAASTQKKSVISALTGETFGQPTAATHPHLLNQGELVPGVEIEEFQQRRLRLITGIQKFARENLQNVTKTNSNHLVIIPSSTKKYMSDKIPYVFRQNSDFFYLSGCLEPDTVLMLSIDEKSHAKSTLFMRPKDKHAELWDGPRTGVDNALDMFGVDEAFASDRFQSELKRLITSNKPLIWYDSNNSDLSKITDDVRHLAGAGTQLNSPANFVQSMRLFKSPAEQALMRRTCQIAAQAINEVMRETKPGQSEHHIYAMVDYKCRMSNANYLAYPPVVASGNNATTIHYINNSQLTKSGDLVLMDAGCEYGGYTSDITRTWPVSGTFTEAQKVLYDVILQLQKELIDTLLKEGGETLDNLFDTMCFKLGKYLQEVGLVPKDIADEMSYIKAGYRFCPHHVSHYLGMDVHDTPLMPRTLRLLPGMVCTVEPGLYIGQERTDVPKEFRGIGVRIEDDILITHDNQVEILTKNCIKERTTLENIFKEKQQNQRL